MKKRVTAFLLSLFLVLSLIPVNMVTAQAADTPEDSYKAVHVEAEEEELVDLDDIQIEDVLEAPLLEADSVNSYKDIYTTGVLGYIYEALEHESMSSTKNGVSISYTYKSGEARSDVEKAFLDHYYHVLTAYKCDHLEKFNWATNRAGVSSYNFGLNSCTFTVYYEASPYYTSAIDATVNQVATKALSEMKATSRYEQVKYLYEWLCDYCSYDYDALGTEDPEKGYYAHSQVGLFVKKTGVCETYSKSFALFCQRLGIPVLVVTGDGHSWNYVKMEDGKWYMLDATWGDQEEYGIDYDYFLVSNCPNVYGHNTDDDQPYPVTSLLSYDPTGTHNYNEQITKEANCTENGIITATCIHCDKVLTVEIPALGHDFVEKTASNGTVTYVCARCGISNGETAPCTDHDVSYVEGVWSDDYTICTDKYVCDKCGEVFEFSAKAELVDYQASTCCSYGYSETSARVVAPIGNTTYIRTHGIQTTLSLDPNNHEGDTEIRNQKAATAQAEGYTGDTYCRSCGGLITAGSKIPKLNHTHKYTAIVTAPTCTTQGYTTHICDCGDSYIDTYVAAKGHSAIAVKGTAATCTATGLTDGSKCATCGTILTAQTTIPALGHTGGTATCTSKAVCTRCGTAYGALKDHTYGTTWVSDQNKHWHVCTVCGAKKDEAAHVSSGAATEDKAETCTVCNYVIHPQLDHVHANHLTAVAAKAATCTESGNSAYYKCSCGKLYQDAQAKTEITAPSIIAALGHTWDAGVITKPATTTEEGIKTVTCTVCGEFYTETIDKLIVKTGTWIKSANGKWWYQRPDGTYPAGKWETISGKWYLFDNAGWMLTGWQKSGNTWYYLGTSGAMVTGWQKINNVWYYFTGSGAMVTGWQKINAKWYYFSASGAMQTGWVNLNGTYYYLYADGHMAANEWVGNKYYVNASGVWTKTR